MLYMLSDANPSLYGRGPTAHKVPIPVVLPSKPQ